MDNKEICWDCEGKMTKKKVDYTLYGILIGTFPATVCEHCHETYFNEDVSKQITQAVKEKGLWGLQAKTTIGQAGNTLDIRLPKRIIEFTSLKKGKEITITPESKNRIVITI